MSLSLLALFALPIHLKLVLDPSGTYRMLKEWSKSPALQFLSAVGPLMLALLIFSTTQVSFAWSWNSLLSWLAVAITLKGISHLIPSLVEWKMRFITEDRLPIFGFIGLLFLLALVYIDTQLLK